VLLFCKLETDDLWKSAGDTGATLSGGGDDAGRIGDTNSTFSYSLKERKLQAAVSRGYVFRCPRIRHWNLMIYHIIASTSWERRCGFEGHDDRLVRVESAISNDEGGEHSGSDQEDNLVFASFVDATDKKK
jgi:hypothetical protein